MVWIRIFKKIVSVVVIHLSPFNIIEMTTQVPLLVLTDKSKINDWKPLLSVLYIGVLFKISRDKSILLLYIKCIGQPLNSKNTVLSTVEINKDYPNEKKWSCLFGALLEPRNSPPLLALSRDSKAGRGVEKFYSEKGKASGVLCWVLAWKLEVGWLERGYPIVWREYLASSAWSWVVSRGKN